MAWVLGMNESGVISAVCTECDKVIVARNYEDISDQIDQHTCDAYEVLKNYQKNIDKVKQSKYTLP